MPNTGLKSAGYPRFGTVMNIQTSPANLIKTFNLVAPVANSTADGYPNGTLAASVSSQGSAPDGYYDKLVLKAHGQFTIDSVGTCAIIYSTSNITATGVSNSCVATNLQFVNSNSAVDARVVFKHGTLITGVSGGNGSPVVLACVNQPNNISVGTRVKVSVGVSSNLLNGPNSDGTWNVSAIGSSTITLASSTGVISPTVTGTGGPDVQSEVVCAVSYIAWAFSSGKTFTNFSNLVFCKLANEAAIDAGRVVDPDYVAQLIALKPAWLRAMDPSGLQSNWEADFAARRPTSYIAWQSDVPVRNPNYYVGTITNNGIVSGADDYTCSAPTITSTGAYKHGEIVIGATTATNSATAATLNINGRGKKRIVVRGRAPWLIDVSAAAASAGLSMQFTWTISGVTLSTVTYTTTTTGPFGDDTASASILRANLAASLQAAGATSGKVFYSNSGGVAAMPLTPQSGTTNLTYSGPAICTIQQVPLLDPDGNPYLNGTRGFAYNYILDAFLARGGGITQSVPLEYYTELCNAVGAGLWYCWSVQNTTAWVSGCTAYFRDNLSSGLRLLTEMGNEMWNPGLEPWGLAHTLGHSLGIGASENGSENKASYSYSAARTRQFGDVAIAAWTTTRPRKDIYISSMSATWDMGNWDPFFLSCSLMGNATFLAYGGPDGTAGSANACTNYTAYPNRVGDNLDAAGIAPYWGSDLLGGDTGDLTNTLGGTVSQNAPLFVAANKYRDANTSGAYDDLYSQFYSAVSTGGPAGGINLLRTYKNQNNQQLETILRKYDPARIAALGKPIAVFHYEGGPQFGVGGINNGTNNATTDIPAVSNRISTRITGAAWDISAYTALSAVAISSGTYNSSSGLITLTLASPVTVPTAGPILGLTGTGTLLADLNGGWNVNTPAVASTTLLLNGPAGKGSITITGGTFYYNAMDLATYIVGMVYNFKYSTQFSNLYKNYNTDITTVHSGREAGGAQYGYSAGQWGLFPVSWTNGTSTAYSSFQAIADFNAGR